MSSPTYYTGNNEPQNDETWQGELGVALAGAFASLVKVPGTTKTIEFIVSSFSSATGSSYATDVAIELEYINESQVKINGVTENVSDLIGGVLTSALTLGLIAGAGFVIGTTLPTEAVLAIGIVAGTGINFAYNRFVDPITDGFLDTLAGTVDVNIQLKSSGNVIGGALHKDGLDGPEWVEVAELLRQSLVTGNLPELEVGMTVDVVEGSGASAQVTSTYKLYDGSLFDEIISFMGYSKEDFWNFSSNNHYHVGSGENEFLYIKDLSDEITIPTGASIQRPHIYPSYHFAFEDILVDVNPLFSDATNYWDRNNIVFGLKKFEPFSALSGGDGDDILLGGDFDTYFYGGQGEDKILAGWGHDRLWGGTEDDELYGNLGNDSLNGEGGVDELYGESGDDVLVASLGDDIYDGGSNSTYSTSELGSKKIQIDVGHAEFKGDTIDYSLIDRAAAGFEWLVVDLYHLSTDKAFMSDILSSADPDSFEHILIDIENVFGSSRRDYIVGTDQTNIFRTNGGSDHIEGKDGDDVFYVHEPQAESFNTPIEIDGGDGTDIVFIEGKQSDYYDPKEITPGVWEYQHKQTLGRVQVTNILPSNVNIGGTVFNPAGETDEIKINGATTHHLQFESSDHYSGGPPNTGNLGVSNVQHNPTTGETTADVNTPDGDWVTVTVSGGGVIMATEMGPNGVLTGVWYDENGNVIGPDSSDPNFSPGVTLWWDGAPQIYFDGQGNVYSIPDLGGLPNYIPVSSSDVLFGSSGDDVLVGGGGPTTSNDDLDDSLDFLNEPMIITSDPILGVYASYGQSENSASPLVFDLDGDGIELSSLLNSNVFWDLDEDGFAENTGWVDADDGFLAIDLDSDGAIAYHTELFGSLTQDGFTDLTALDSNSDGVINASDTQFSDLLVWRDINQNGTSGSDELFTLSELDITEIDLYATQQFNVFNEGHTVSHVSSYTIDDGINTPITREISDIWFEYDNINTLSKESFDYDERTLGLPDQRGYGVVSNLYIAASQDNDLTDIDSLMSLLYQFVGKGLDNYFTDDRSIMDEVETILFRWAGVDSVDPTSRGDYIDARRLEFLEEFLDDDYIQGGTPDPGTLAAMLANKAFEIALYAFTGRFIAQAVSNDLFDGSATYNYASDALEGVTGFNQDGLDALLAKSNDGTKVQDKMTFWINVVNSIDQSVGLSNLSSPDVAALENTILASDSTLTIQQLLDKRDKNIEDTLSWTPDGDSISGTTGDDVYTGSVGDDVYLGNYGNDTLSGGLGNDTFYGAAGDDILEGQLGDDSLVGQGGADTYLYSNGHGNDFIQEQHLDVDKIIFSAGLSASDILVSRIEGSDLFLQVDPNVGSGSITINGYVELMEFSDSTVIDIRTLDMVTNGTSGADTLYGAKTNIGGSGVDTIYGYDGDDILHGFATSEADYSNNYLDGGAGNDELYGGRGDDVFYMGSGDDLAVDSINGDDTFVYTGGLDHIYTKFGNDTLVLDIDTTINDISITTTGSYDATLVIDVGVNELFLQYQQSNNYKIETIQFRDGFTADLGDFQSWQYGTTYSEILNGTSSADTIVGKSGSDEIYGFSGNDHIHGGWHSDKLYGGDGLDNLWGGVGADTFVFESATAFNDVDIIGDFDTYDGDIIDISDLLSGYDPLTDDISDFVKIMDDGTDSSFSIDADGGADNFVQIATLLNVTYLSDPSALESPGFLIAS